MRTIPLIIGFGMVILGFADLAFDLHHHGRGIDFVLDLVLVVVGAAVLFLVDRQQKRDRNNPRH